MSRSKRNDFSDGPRISKGRDLGDGSPPVGTRGEAPAGGMGTKPLKLMISADYRVPRHP